MKKKQVAAAVNVALVPLFAAACAAAQGMAVACDKLARAIIGKGRGDEAYGKAVKELAALETASTDGNKHTVRRYTGEALAILAQHGGKVIVPTVAKERTEKAQAARKSLGRKPRGVKKPGKAADAAVAPMSAQDGEAWFRAQLKLQAGRASLIAIAQSEGFDLTFGLRSERVIATTSTAPTLPAPSMPKAEKPVSPEARKPGTPRDASLPGAVIKPNGAKKPNGVKRAAH